MLAAAHTFGCCFRFSLCCCLSLSYVNRDDLDLSSVHDTAAAQELELVDDMDGYLDYPLKQSKFQNVNSLLLFVTEAVGEGQSGIQHVNLKGVSTKVRHDSAFSE